MQRDALLLTLMFTLGTLACGEDPETAADEGIVLGGTDETSGAEPDGAAEDDDGDEGSPSGGDGDGDPDAEEQDEGCASVSEAAEVKAAPVDIIFVVDNSGSMTDEAEFVRTQMNGFSDQIQMSGIDHHVVLLSSYPDEGNGICLDPPLGGGNCPADDNNLPIYRHVDLKIGSHNALIHLVATQLEWKDSIRPEAMKHIVVVSDDESELPHQIFDTLFSGLDPSYDSYVFHSIVCLSDCSEAANIGQTYIELTDQTGGVLGDLCLQDFQTVFDEIAKSVIQSVPLSCQFDIPTPPEGMALDPDLVNVELGDGNNLEVIPRVDDIVDCMNHPDGWYYDDPLEPSEIRLCPQTCESAQGYEQGTINVQFGCDTYVPIE
jgi:hypothetical protein